MSAAQHKDLYAPMLSKWYARPMPNNDIIGGLWFPRESSAKARRNLVHGIKETLRTGSIVGAPTFQTGYTSFASNQKYIQTNIAESSLMTLVAIVRTTADAWTNATRPVFIGNYTGTAGSMIYLTSTSPSATKFIRGQGYDAAGANKFRVLDISASYTAFAMYAMVFSATAITLYNRTLATSSTLAITTTPARVLSAEKFRLFSSNSSAFSGGIGDMAAAMIIPAAASTTQLDDWRTVFNAELNPLGISV